MQVLEGHKRQVRCVAYAPDGKLLASGSNDKTVRLWDLMAAREVTTLPGHPGLVYCIAFSPDGRWLASGDYHGTTILWELATGRSLATFTGHYPGYSLSDQVSSVAFAPNGQTLAIGCGARGYANLVAEVRVRDIPEGSLSFARPYQGGIWSLTYTRDGRFLVLGTGNRAVVLLETATGEEQAVLSQKAGVMAVAVAPDARIIAAAAGWVVHLWDLPARRVRATLKGHRAKVWSMAFSPDGRTLLTGGWDGTVRMWDVASGRELAAFDWQIGKIHGVAFSPDGMTAAAGGDRRKVIVWDVDDLHR